MKRLSAFLGGMTLYMALIPGLTLSQEVVWNHILQSTAQYITAQQTSDGGYILAGSKRCSNLSPYNYAAWLLKTDSEGQTEWERLFEDSVHADVNRANSVQQTSDGGYILAGLTVPSDRSLSRKPWLIKTGSEGQEEWKRTFGDSDMNEAKSVRQTSDGGYILAGSLETGGYWGWDARLIKTDSKGQKEWERTFGGKIDDQSDGAYSVQQTSDGGYILAGYSKTAGSWSYAAWLIKTDSNGQKEWERTFGGEGNNQCDDASSVRQTSDGGYILAGRREYYRGDDHGWDAWLIKTDSKGYKEWDRIFAEGQGMTLTYSVQQTLDGGYILAGEREHYLEGSPNSLGWVIKTNSNGQKEWDKTFYYSDDEWPKGYTYADARTVQQTSDGDYIVVGNLLSTSMECGIWLTKLKGEPLTLVEEEFNIPETFTLSQNFPNPFNPRTEITFEIPTDSQVTLTVFNALGQKVATLVDERREAGKYQTTWDGTNFPSGVYFYRLEIQSSTKTMKMLSMK